MLKSRITHCGIARKKFAFLLKIFWERGRAIGLIGPINGTPTNPCVLRYAYKRSYPNILDSLNTKNGRSATPLSSDRNLFITALKDSAKALVERD